MAPVAKRRKVEHEVRKPKKKPRVRKQTAYHSSSEDEESQPHAKGEPQVKAPTSIPYSRSILKKAQAGGSSGLEGVVEIRADSETELAKNTAQNSMPPDSESDADEDSTDATALNDEPALSASGSGSEEEDEQAQSDSDTSLTSSQHSAPDSRKKRNDPNAFATSISRILDTKLTTAKRADPVLSRSKSASEANKELADSKLEQRARAQIRAEKRQALEKGRVRDVLGLEDDEVETGKVLEEEKRLKKTAQRGVVKLFNAVRAAQVHADEGRRKAREEGLVGLGRKEERVNEMSKQGFLDLISRGGKEKVSA